MAQATKYNQWYTEERPLLFEKLVYQDVTPVLLPDSMPKVGTPLALGIVQKVLAQKTIVAKYLARSTGYLLHYHRSPLYWIRAMDFEPFFKSPDRERSVHHFRDLYAIDERHGKFIGAVLNSNLFFLWFVTVGNCRNLTGEDVKNFQVGTPTAELLDATARLFDRLMTDYKDNSRMRTRGTAELQEFYPSRSKPIIDEIDRVLARHYGFTDEELDFIIHYDIKYRMGRDAEIDGDEGEK